MHVFSQKGSFIVTKLVDLNIFSSNHKEIPIKINTKFDHDKLNDCMRVRNLTSAMFVCRTAHENKKPSAPLIFRRITLLTMLFMLKLISYNIRFF